MNLFHEIKVKWKALFRKNLCRVLEIEMKAFSCLF